MDENTKKIIMMFKRKTLGVDSVIRQASHLEAKLKATQEEIEESNVTLDKYKSENSGLKQLLQEKETVIEEIAEKTDQERDNWEKLRDELKTEVAQLKAKLEQKEKEILEVEVTVKEFEKVNRQVDELKAELGQKKDEVASLQIELGKSKNKSPEKRKLAEMKFEFETKIQDLTANLDISEDKYNQLKASFDNQIGENQKLSAEIEKLKQQIAETKPPAKPKNFISFFNKKAILPVKKPPQKKVKFFKKERIDANEYPIGDGPDHHRLPGFLPPALKVVPGEYILPPAFEIEQQQQHKKTTKRKPAEDKIKTGPKATAKRSRVSHVTESPKKTPLTKKSSTPKKSSAPKESTNETTPIPIVKTPPLIESRAEIESKKPIAKPIVNHPAAKTVIANPISVDETLIGDQISKPKSKIPPIPPPKTKKSLANENLSENSASSNAIEKSVENLASTSASTSKSMVKAPIISTQRQKFRNNFSSEEIIPLGNKKLANASQPGPERAAKHFVMTPEALKAINARKVTAHKKFAPLAPLPKKPENDPTLRKRSAPTRPAQNKVINNPQQLPHSQPPLPTNNTKNEKAAVQNEKVKTISSVLPTPPLEDLRTLSKNNLKRKRILDSDSSDDDDIVKPSQTEEMSPVEKDQKTIDSSAIIISEKNKSKKSKKESSDVENAAEPENIVPGQKPGTTTKPSKVPTLSPTLSSPTSSARSRSSSRSTVRYVTDETLGQDEPIKNSIVSSNPDPPNRQNSLLEDSGSDVEMEAIRVEDNQLSVVAQDLDLSDNSDDDDEEKDLNSIEKKDCNNTSQNEVPDNLEVALSSIFESPPPKASTSNDKSSSVAPAALAVKINSPPTEADKNDKIVQKKNKKEKKISFLEQMSFKFKTENKLRETRKTLRSKANRSNNENDFQLCSNLIKAKLGNLWNPNHNKNNREIFEDAIKTLTSSAEPMLYKRLTIQHIYVAVRDEKNWDNLEWSNGPNKPKMTWLQGKALTLLIHLEEKLNYIIKDFRHMIRHFLFGRRGVGREAEYRVHQLANITRFYHLLSRYQGDDDAARQFLHDVLYFRPSRSHIMMNIVLETWPEILRKQPDMGPNGPIDPLTETIIYMIYNTGPTQGLHEMKVFDCRNNLKYLGFPMPPLTADELAKKFVKTVEEFHSVQIMKNSITMALTLLARCRESQWAHQHIVSRLFDLIGIYFEKLEDEKSRNIFTWVLNTLGQVVRVYPVEQRSELTDIFEPLLELPDKVILPTAELEEAWLRAVIWCGHHFQLQVVKKLFYWRPLFPLSPEVENLVANFVGTRASKFTDTTIEYQKKYIQQRMNQKKKHMGNNKHGLNRNNYHY